MAHTHTHTHCFWCQIHILIYHTFLTVPLSIKHPFCFTMKDLVLCLLFNGYSSIYPSVRPPIHPCIHNKNLSTFTALTYTFISSFPKEHFFCQSRSINAANSIPTPHLPFTPPSFQPAQQLLTPSFFSLSRPEFTYTLFAQTPNLLRMSPAPVFPLSAPPPLRRLWCQFHFLVFYFRGEWGEGRWRGRGSRWALLRKESRRNIRNRLSFRCSRSDRTRRSGGIRT